MRSDLLLFENKLHLTHNEVIVNEDVSEYGALIGQELEQKLSADTVDGFW